MGGGVIALDVAAARLVHLSDHRRRLEYVGEVPHHGARAVHLLHTLHLERPPLPLHASRVAHLATGLSVKRILLEHDVDPVLDLAELEHAGLSLRRVVTDPALPAL